MKKWMMIFIPFTFLTEIQAAASTSKDVYEEFLYQEYQSALVNNRKVFTGLTTIDQSLFVDALWDLVEENKNQAAIAFLDQHQTFNYELVERLRIEILRLKNKRLFGISEELATDLTIALLNPVVETRLIYILASFEQELLDGGHEDLVALARKHDQYFDIIPDKVKIEEFSYEVVSDLFHKTPDTTTYMNGEYLKGIKLFMFCREQRLYPCLMVMKNSLGEVVRNDDGSIWSQPALASSSQGLPSYTRNGNTPAGILTIDSVMPHADQRISFGKFRRMILNFVPKSKDEVLMKSLLPESSHQHNWWKAAQVARDIGRNLLRIHGTGKMNRDSSTPYFPFMRTSGCIAQRENTYEGIIYQDQRTLLDQVMTAMELTPNYENEVKVKGLLYIIDIDDQLEAVSTYDLALRGIE